MNLNVKTIKCLERMGQKSSESRAKQKALILRQNICKPHRPQSTSIQNILSTLKIQQYKENNNENMSNDMSWYVAKVDLHMRNKHTPHLPLTKIHI